MYAVKPVLKWMHERQPRPWLVAIVGIPGSGKSTLANELVKHIPGAVVLPMDGYHLPRTVLTRDQLERRGAPETFDSVSLGNDLMALRTQRTGRFPSFDHALKDPQGGAIEVLPGTPLVIVEGLYLLLEAWGLTDTFDATIFLDCDLAVALDRVARRHLAAGLASTLAEAQKRATTNDRRNANFVLADGCRERADLVLPSTFNAS